MPLADHLEQPPRLPGNACVTCRWYEKLAPDDRAFFDNWLQNGWQYKQLVEACRKEGLDVADGSFRRHCNEHHKRGK